MRRYREKLIKTIQNNNLFIKMFFVMVVSIISVSVLITFSTIRMSENLFMETFGITNTKTLNQIKSRFESFSYAVVSTSINVQNNGTIKRVLTQEELNSIEKAKSNYNVIKQMERIYSTVAPYEADIIVAGKNNDLFNMNYSDWPVSWKDLHRHVITQNTVEQPANLLYQFVPSSSLNNEPLIVATKALTERSTNNIYGILYISISERNFKKFYQNYTSQGNNMAVLNGNGKIISSNQETWIGKESMKLLATSKEMEDSSLDYKDVEVFGKNYMLLSAYLPTFDMYLVNLIDKDSVLDNLVNTKEIVMISIGIVLLAVLVVFIISRRMTNSLSKLIQQISNMVKYDFSKPVIETGSYEARKIATAFNFMLNELQEYVGIVVQTQERQRNAELKALQHQINPHFLYNTLTSVKFMVQQGKKEKATDTIHSLISLLQNALGDINQTITVEKELSNMKDYVLINQSRYGERIKVNYFISPNCLQFHMPKLVIQPFIENAFFHAFNQKKEGYIQILIAQIEENLVCEIIDNGDGIESSTTDFNGKRHLFSGIGVRNVHERIQLLYGDEYGIEISSEISEGTKVKIKLPLIEE
ncbi:sensor histidine kinase [Virgibacillus necropolis]|uniref:sensor histidine kinase n=1 Tax=Virgibacillus necropolis TaxID=163877 RepID=UPI00384FD8B6